MRSLVGSLEPSSGRTISSWASSGSTQTDFWGKTHQTSSSFQIFVIPVQTDGSNPTARLFSYLCYGDGDKRCFDGIEQGVCSGETSFPWMHNKLIQLAELREFSTLPKAENSTQVDNLVPQLSGWHRFISWMCRSIKTPFQWLHLCDNSQNRRDEFQPLSDWEKDTSELPSSRGVTSSCSDSWLTDKKEITHFRAGQQTQRSVAAPFSKFYYLQIVEIEKDLQDPF